MDNLTTDFSRHVYCLFGLPFDAVSLEQAAEIVEQAVRHRQSCFFSTPNLNFLIGCMHDEKFRNSVIRSNLSLADGMPLVWLAKLVGVPIMERVAGSNLFDALWEKKGNPLSVYFFGGADGVAKQAHQRLNSVNTGLVSVGYYSPGFASVTALSKPAIIKDINTSGADFLVVALGAKKGQEWIEHNMSRLNIAAVSHLGAVVNFVANTISRAPALLQRIGLEWLWRIKEEPPLWKRYLSDGWALIKLLLFRVIPLALTRLWYSKTQMPLENEITVINESDTTTLKLSGNWSSTNRSILVKTCIMITKVPEHVCIDMENVQYIDSSIIALLMLLYGHQTKIGRKFKIISASPKVCLLLRLNCASFLNGGFNSEVQS